MLHLMNRSPDHPILLACLQLAHIVPDAFRVDAHIALADTGKRTHIHAAATTLWGNANDDIVLEPKPEGGRGGFNTSLGRIVGHNLPAEATGRRQGAVKGLGRWNVEAH